MATIIHSPIASGLVRPGPVVVKPPFEFRAATVINFDDVPDGTVIDTHYAAKGATFASVTTSPAKRWSTYARSIWGIESAPNGVSLVPPPTLSLFDARQGGIEVTFDKAQRWVSIDAQPILPPEYMTPPTARPFLEAYDAKGKLLGRVYYPLPYGDAAYGSWQTLIYSSSVANIVKVIFSSQYNGGTPVYAVFDQLAFCTTNSLLPHPLG